MVKLIWKAKAFLAKLDNHIQGRMVRITLFLEAEVKRLISKGNKTGRTPSKDGQPPRVVTGTLRANVTHDVKKGITGVQAFVGVRKGPASKYAPLLESKGIRDGTTRPFLRPTVLKNRVKILNMLG